VKNYPFDAIIVGPPNKLEMSVVLSREMVEHPNGAFREDIGASLDASTVAGTSPSGLLNGVTPLTAATTAP
jgi:hypothetical protein